MTVSRTRTILASAACLCLLLAHCIGGNEAEVDVRGDVYYYPNDTARQDNTIDDATGRPDTGEDTTVAPDVVQDSSTSPDTQSPDTVAPDTLAPDTSTRDTSTPDTSTPDTSRDTSTPDTAADTREDRDNPTQYPNHDNQLRYGRVIPPLHWDGAYFGASQTTLDLYDVYTSDEYDNVSVLIFVAVTGWCGNCPDYVRQIASIANNLLGAGAMIIYVELEDRNERAASSSQANSYINGYIGSTDSYRVGDGDTKVRQSSGSFTSSPPLIYNAPFIQSFPSAFVVRRSDMVIITDQSRSEYTLPFVAIARNPNADWSRPVPGAEDNCGPADEESYEPNDTAATAATIRPGTFSGGICGTPDFYRIDIQGSWTLSLSFSHATGDIDTYLWNVARDEVARDGSNNPIGSDSATDNESFSNSGPATVIVLGYQGASAPYQLTLTEH